MKINAIVASRMTSTRLPGKIMKVIHGKPSLVHLIDRIKRSKYINEVIIATTRNATDDIVVKTAEEQKVSFYRGSEEDVLARTTEAALVTNTDIIVQITSDCPLVDAETIDTVIEKFINHPYLDYVSNQLVRTFPLGFSVEVFRTSDLVEIEQNVQDKAVREHVSLYFYENPDKYNLSNVEAPVFLRNPHFRLTLDTKQDFELISNVFENLYPLNKNFNLYDITRYLNMHPQLLNINQAVVQKKPR